MPNTYLIKCVFRTKPPSSPVGSVVIWDMLDEGEDTAQALREAGHNVAFMRVSVTDVPSVEEAVRTVLEQFGQIDILVNNAGITRDRTLLKMSHLEWQQVIDVNLTGVFNCTKAVVPHMAERGYGRIICTSSVVGIHGNFGQTNYAVLITKRKRKNYTSKKKESQIAAFALSRDFGPLQRLSWPRVIHTKKWPKNDFFDVNPFKLIAAWRSFFLLAFLRE